MVTGVSLRDRQKLYTHNLLLDAAAQLIEERGYAQTTIDDVAQVAGTSRATFYSHFGGKDDIARELASQMWERAEEFYVDFANLPNWKLPTIRQWLDRVADKWEADRARTRVVSETRVQELQNEYVLRHQRFVKHMLTPTQRWKHLSAEEAEMRALTLIVQLESSCYAWIVAGYPIERELLFDTLAQIWVKTLTAPPVRK